MRLFGDDPGSATVTAPSIGDLTVSKSGESILFTPRGPQGEALAIAGVRSSDDVQVLQVVGTTAGATCTLTFDGATTAPIPLQPMPPLTSFVWRATLPHAGSYNLWLAWDNFYGRPPGSHICTQALVEVFASGQRLGSVAFDQSQFPSPTADLPIAGLGVFKAMGAFSFAGTDLEVRLSGPADPTGLILAGMLRIVPAGSADPRDVGYVDVAPNRAAGSDGALEGAAATTSYGDWSLTYFYTGIGSWLGGYYATPTGTATTGFPAAADVEKALNGLPNVVAGSLRAGSPTNKSIAVQFAGAMGGRAWSTLTCSDPAVRVVHDGTAGSSVGGDYPSVTINGTTQPLRALSYAPGKPRMAFHLVQDAPAVQHQRYGEGLYQNFGYWGGRDGIGYGNRVGYVDRGGPAANWRFQGLAGPADFRVDITWPAGDPAADVLQCTAYDAAGNVLAAASGIDQARAPADLVDADGTGWKTVGRFTLPLQVNAVTVIAQGAGTAGKHIILDTVRLTRVSADRGAQVRPGDVVAFRMPPNFIATAAGTVAAVAAAPVAPAPATRLPAIPRDRKAMKLGYNCDWPVYFANDSCYANMAIQASQPIGLAQDARGNPSRLGFDAGFGCGSAQALIVSPPSDASGRGYGVPTCGPGVWVLQWTGSPWNFCGLQPQYPSTSVVEIATRATTVGRVNRRYYQVDVTTPAAPNLMVRFLSTQKDVDGTYRCDLSDVAIFPPDVDPDSASHWRPSFLEKLRGVQCFRFMDMLGTNDMNLSEFAHLPDRANFPLGYTGRTIAVPIASIGPPTPDPFSESVGGTVVRVTTKVPHGLADGFLVGLRTTDGTALGPVIGNVIDPRTGATTAATRDPFDPTDNYQGGSRRNMCRVIDATTVQVGIECYYGPVARMANTITPANGVLFADLAPHTLMGMADVADLSVASGLEPWVNVPWLATDDCVARMARALAAGLPAGRVVHVEYGNEPWNYAFVGCGFCIRMAKALGIGDGSYIPYYTRRMGQVHRIFRDTWAAQGRDPAEVRRVCGVQQENPGGTTLGNVTYALANGISFDEVAPACYYNNGPAAGPVDDLLTREQLLDLFAMNVQQSDMPAHMAGHLQVCRNAFAQNPTQAWLRDVVLVNYEGGPDTMTTATMSANLAARNHGVHRHPDFCEIELHHLQMLEDAGVTLFNIFSLYGTRETSQWGVYEGYRMQPGTGDATLDAANVDDFENLAAIKSETAAALMKWSALRQASPPAARVLRNGFVRTYGRAVAY